MSPAVTAARSRSRWSAKPVRPGSWAGGANRPSLIEARANFKEFGASEQRFVTKVRTPLDDVPLDQNWRPIAPDRDHFEPRGRQGALRPVDCTVLYWWCHRDTGFWRRSS
ncbi:CPCC family cysteine-rich protein [Streptomyces sp. NBC_00328]|uniref:CPCC family cysteine-rich protein n=1 Tax=Streptomyces sp. NBC_00328 TaxID=2903646 RepID=UPI003FA6F584